MYLQLHELFIFGIASDWKKFESELSIDPTHTMTLWPGVNAITINEFLLKFSNDDALMSKQNHDARNNLHLICLENDIVQMIIREMQLVCNHTCTGWWQF